MSWHKMEVILLGLSVYGTLFKFYLLLMFLQNNYTKLATYISRLNVAVNTAQLLAGSIGASEC